MRKNKLDQLDQVIYHHVKERIKIMRSYSVYEAKTQLSRVLSHVKRGMEIVVTERGTPIARVVPLLQDDSFEERIRHLMSTGALIPAKRKKLPRGRNRPGGLARFLRERE